MRNSESGIADIDLWSVLDALKLRWWIVPLAMLVSAGFLFANESDLQTSPGYTQISRTYEARDESAVLTVVGLDPASIVPYPSFDNQLLVVQSIETREQIAASIGAETSVSVSRSEQKFSLLDTIEGEGTKRFTFLSVGTPSYTFGCAAPTNDECNIAIDAYVQEISRMRAESIQQGFVRAEKLVSALTSNSQDKNQSLLLQQQALAYVKTLVNGEIKLISTTFQKVGPTVSTVKASTYIFGLGVGALLGLLIVLQLTVTDRKIRTIRKLVVTIGENNVLGALNTAKNDPSHQFVSAAIVHQAARHNDTSVRLLPVDETVNIDSATATITQALNDHALIITSISTVGHITTTELLPSPNSIIVLVAHRGTSRTDDLEKVWAIAEHAGNTIAGVILVQHQP